MRRAASTFKNRFLSRTATLGNIVNVVRAGIHRFGLIAASALYYVNREASVKRGDGLASPTTLMHRKHKYALTEGQRRMYASEKLTNFRWISKVLASRSSYPLTEKDRPPPEIEAELGVLGQFAETAYSTVPIPFLFQNVTTLLQHDFPLEGYDALRDATLVSFVEGRTGHLPAFVAYRPSTKQLVVATSGTSTLQLALYDLCAVKHRHPSRRGHVHSGFWSLYEGIKPLILDAISKGIQENDVNELVITGHSMGGSISYLLCMDLLASDHNTPFPFGLSLKLAVFGAPRTGDAYLVKYWRELMSAYQKLHGPGKLTEYSVKAYNDGVPALRPSQLGYRHFAREPLYLDRTRLYQVPASEAEHALFTAAPLDPHDQATFQFPRGGHNYYNCRDFERLGRRIKWLYKANPDDSGWEERYRERFAKHQV